MFREPATNFVQYKLHINKNYTVEEYRLYLKRGDKLQGEFFRCKLIKIQINRRPERVVFQLNWIFYIEDYIQQQTLKLCGIFTCNWNNTFKIHVPNLMAVKSSYFLSSIILKNVQNILHLSQYKHGHILSWTVVPFKGPRAVANGLTGIKSVLVKCLVIFN